MQILNSLIPIFAVIALGMVLRWRQFLTAATTQGFNQFAYFFALPLFLFYRLGEAPVADQADAFLWTLLGASAITMVLGWLLAHWMVPFPARGAMIQASFRGNLAFIGLPLVLFVVEDQARDFQDGLEAAILLAMAPVVIFYNIASVTALAVYQRQAEHSFSWKAVLVSICLNPILLGCVGGMLLQKSGWVLPVAVQRTCVVVGAAAFPMALLGIGSQLATVSVKGQWASAAAASVLKCVACPLIGWGLGYASGLGGVELQVIVIMCAVPTAVSSFVLADQMKGDAELAASAVVMATVLSMLTLSIILAIT